MAIGQEQQNQLASQPPLAERVVGKSVDLQALNNTNDRALAAPINSQTENLNQTTDFINRKQAVDGPQANPVDAQTETTAAQQYQDPVILHANTNPQQQT